MLIFTVNLNLQTNVVRLGAGSQGSWEAERHRILRSKPARRPPWGLRAAELCGQVPSGNHSWTRCFRRLPLRGRLTSGQLSASRILQPRECYAPFLGPQMATSSFHQPQASLNPVQSTPGSHVASLPQEHLAKNLETRESQPFCNWMIYLGSLIYHITIERLLYAKYSGSCLAKKWVSKWE